MQTPWDQRIARVLVRRLARTPITPNQLTAVTVLVAFVAAALFATGDPTYVNVAAGLFVLSRFLDHFDGELARLKSMSSRLGYYFDYLAGAGSYSALFLGIGIGLANGPLDTWGWVLGWAGAASAVISLFINLGIDRARTRLAAGRPEKDAVGYPSIAGFELEDGIYLLAPITWLGFILPFFVAAAIGATVYTLVSAIQLIRLQRA
ncbi:MAG: CDP-alcohol phosphatidyltransferase family protein [Rhodospirillales bacterium]|nr:CDP-alcohol phosphatidyltransferase family protein [Rhodospirillales bacterium]